MTVTLPEGTAFSSLTSLGLDSYAAVPEGRFEMRHLTGALKSVPGADAAFPQSIPPGFQVAIGYFGGPEAYHDWPPQSWKDFPGAKLPLWVAGMNGAEEGAQAVAALRALGVPPGAITGVDMETRIDTSYILNYYDVLSHAGYKLWVYGSAGNVFHMPSCNGYFVAQYDGDPVIDFPGLKVRAKQYRANVAPGIDLDSVVLWTLREMWGQI